MLRQYDFALYPFLARAVANFYGVPRFIPTALRSSCRRCQLAWVVCSCCSLLALCACSRELLKPHMTTQHFFGSSFFPESGLASAEPALSFIFACMALIVATC